MLSPGGAQPSPKPRQAFRTSTCPNGAASPSPASARPCSTCTQGRRSQTPAGTAHVLDARGGPRAQHCPALPIVVRLTGVACLTCISSPEVVPPSILAPAACAPEFETQRQEPGGSLDAQLL